MISNFFWDNRFISIYFEIDWTFLKQNNFCAHLLLTYSVYFFFGINIILSLLKIKKQQSLILYSDSISIPNSKFFVQVSGTHYKKFSSSWRKVSFLFWRNENRQFRTHYILLGDIVDIDCNEDMIIVVTPNHHDWKIYEMICNAFIFQKNLVLNFSVI